jgi:hypothetical protein
MPLSLLFIPVLLAGAAISIPVTGIIWLVLRWQEKHFARAMCAVGRSMTWTELQSAIEKQNGTIIAEGLSEKGPYRLWWTAENIRAVSPDKCYPADSSPRFYPGPYLDPEFAPFFEWCYIRFTHPHVGVGRLVSVPKEKQERLLELLPGCQFVSTYSPPRIRKKFGKPELSAR